MVRQSQIAANEDNQLLYPAHLHHSDKLGNMIPANRIGSQINGGPFSLVQLKVIQEAIYIIVFGAIVTLCFKGEALAWNHIVAFILLILAVYFVFIK